MMKNEMLREQPGRGMAWAAPPRIGSSRAWQHWAPYAAVTWSLIYAVLGIYWALGGRGFPYNSEAASDTLGPLLGRLGPGVAWSGVMLAGIPAALLGTAMLRGVRSKALRALLITAGILLAGVLLLLMTSLNLLVKFGYLPLAVINIIQGTEFGQTYLKGLTEWQTVHQILCLAGGFLWLAATFCYARRSVNACLYCGRQDGPEGWTNPANARRWGRIAVYVAMVAPIFYAFTRYAWALGFPLGMDSARFLNGQENGIWLVGALSHGNFMLVGAVFMLGLVQHWGEIFPRWMIGLAGRRVPIALAVIPASLVSVLLVVGGIGIWASLDQLLANLTALGAGTIEINSAIIFELGPTLLFPLWGAALALATLGYYCRRRGPCSVCGRDASGKALSLLNARIWRPDELVDSENTAAHYPEGKAIQKVQRMFCLFVIILLAGCLTQSCSSILKSQPEAEYWPTQNWQSTSPEAQGMDSAMLAELFEAIEKDDVRLHSLLIARNGYLVTEAYWPPYGPNDVHTIESNTKSMIGTLIGVAMNQGILQGVDQKLVDFFPERTIQNLDEQKKSITIQNLLSMTPGLSCQDLSSEGQGMFNAKDWVQYLLDLPVSDPPGSRWVYCSGTAHLLSAILQEAAGTDTRSYANTYLFKPLGIPEVPEQDWNAAPGGVTNGVAGLYLAPRDLAKFGYLYLKQGNWNGQQVVPIQWVEESTREQAYIGPDDYVGGLDRRFGYMWSIFPDLKYYGYLGMAGQELFVVPDQNLVIVFTGALPVGKEADLLRLVNDYIIPAALSVDSLPENPQASSRLEALIQHAAGSQQPVPPLPQTALEITGKTYKLDLNPLGWQDMTFAFQSGSDTAILGMSGSPDLEIGLDQRYRLTESPVSRPVGLRGRWLAADEFELDYIIQGEFIESVGRFKFEGSTMSISITNLNYGGPPMKLYGSMAEHKP